MPRCAIVGSAFSDAADTPPTHVQTPFGEAVLYAVAPGGWLLPRHGRPHRFLPHQVPYRAHAWALRHLGVDALLVTSSCGVLDRTLPLFTPLLVTDLVWPDNRLPDGSAATMWPEPCSDQGHLVVEASLFDATLSAHLRDHLRRQGAPSPEREVVFWYAPGPRTKTRAENRWLAEQGLHVNSMTLAPEVVLANELGIPTVAAVVGHKHSGPRAPGLDEHGIADSLERSRALDSVTGRRLPRRRSGRALRQPRLPVRRMTPEVAAGHVGRAGFLVTGPAVPLVGGHLNEVFRVPTSAGSVVLKHAPPYVAAAPEVPLDPDRLRHEALGLAMGGTLWRPGRVPQMLVYDPAHQVLCMEDLGDRRHLGSWLASADDDAAAALLLDLGRHIGQLHGATADPEAWANPDVQATRHQLQYSQVPDFLAAHGYERGLGAQAVALGEALQRPGRGPIMGDLWLSSVLVDGHDWALIDWELSHWGHPLQDVAHLRAHLFLADPERAASRVAAFEEGYRATAPSWDGAQHEGARVHEASELLARTVGAFPMVERDDPCGSAAMARAVALLGG